MTVPTRLIPNLNRIPTTSWLINSKWWTTFCKAQGKGVINKRVMIKHVLWSCQRRKRRSLSPLVFLVHAVTNRWWTWNWWNTVPVSYKSRSLWTNPMTIDRSSRFIHTHKMSACGSFHSLSIGSFLGCLLGASCSENST